ncbi:GNAT family N-acetyltransferase [Cytobacillus massiliigabonensis]|uniref:GNAT family N-acetyltransferase n=1 Tax=Cytobacillus massiliigabonensis TaxID=1871011 RepID=UPI000C84E9D6|nr:GNAT family N-acetyltransferase [Cytobacillus massiliigabonensis]
MNTERKLIDLHALSYFIAKLNGMNEHHVGYCGKKHDEILNTLLNKFSDLPIEECFSVMYKENEIIAALGLDISLEDKEAELWGPFIYQNNWEDAVNTIWNDLSRKIEDRVNVFHGFYGEENINGNAFMSLLGAEKKGMHLTLKSHNKDFNYQQDSSIKEINEAMFADFIKMHENAFPNTYYSGIEILEKLNGYNKVFIIEEDFDIAGYVYVEGNPEFKEGNIEYISVSPNQRNKGIGTRLMKRAMHFLFTELRIKEITICVEATNLTAINLYKKAGFVEDHRLIHFIKVMG